MISIDKVMISDEIVEEQFVCDLTKCKGACCVDGDAGAPLEEAELKIIDRVFNTIKKRLSPGALAVIEEKGRYEWHNEFGWVTTTIGAGICVYGYTDEQGIVKCAFEQAFYDGEIDWKKPLSCHFFPIIVEEGRMYDRMNYEPRTTHCAPACKLGKSLKVPVYRFLKEPIIRKYGEEFYNALDHIAKEIEAGRYETGNRPKNKKTT
ncbi:MAG: DUF3109 family protein [Dinghuibacter sp.]|nr:DUF3109 family protein [Dinghuibacter sp.]